MRTEEDYSEDLFEIVCISNKVGFPKILKYRTIALCLHRGTHSSGHYLAVLADNQHKIVCDDNKVRTLEGSIGGTVSLIALVQVSDEESYEKNSDPSAEGTSSSKERNTKRTREQEKHPGILPLVKKWFIPRRLVELWNTKEKNLKE